MSILFPTLFLKQLIESSKQLDDKKNPPFTAERFVLSIINRFTWEYNEFGDVEIEQLEKLLKKAFPDIDATREALVAYSMEKEYVAFSDDLYMRKLSRALSKSGEFSENKPIDAVTLLLLILKEPTETLKPLIANVSFNEFENLDISKAQEPSIPTQTNATEEPLVEDEIIWEEDDELPFDEGVQETPREEKAEAKSAEKDPKGDMARLVDKIKDVRTKLHETVFGQDNAINTFVTGYFRANMLPKIDAMRRRPRATFLFAGPPGVGKTLLAESAAEVLGIPFKRFDMSEYADKEAPLEFCGSDKVYKNGKPGNVTSFVAENPNCILLFDEIEKAHISAIHLFLQMLDAGRLRDNYTDVEVSFTNTIIIMTTNAGRQLYENSDSGDFSNVSKKVIINALQNDKKPGTDVPFFPGAICSRFASGNVVMFNQIGAHNLRTIAKKEIERQANSLQDETKINIKIDENVYTALLFAEGAAADARTVRSRAEAFFNDELYELLRLVASEKSNSRVEDIENINITVDLEDSSKDISELFNMQENKNILVFANPETVVKCDKLMGDSSCIGVQTVEDAIETVKSKNIDVALIDIMCGASKQSSNSLNIEDVDSPARDFLKFLRGNTTQIPVCLIEDGETTLGEEEKISFMRQGVREILGINQSGEEFAEKLAAIINNLHQQSSMNKLTKENKLITFESAQSLSEDGKNAEIKLFDFRLGVAVDSQDAKNILSAVSKPNVRFNEVIGASDAKKELTYFVQYLKNPKKYLGTGVKAPKGIILYGPPGTGKTMLAKAMACEADVTFIAAEGNQFLKSYVGQGSEKVHELFRTARKYAPSILFIDEIDAIAKERTGGNNGAAGIEATLTAFLTEMDGFSNDPTRPVFVLAATNFNVEPGTSKSLDPALMRRFDRRIYIDLPDKEERIRFMKMKMQKNPALQISKTQIKNIAMRSTGMSLAELDSAFELALRSAIRQGSMVVTDAVLEEAYETFKGGEIKEWDEATLERVARHEAGHALVCWLSGETPSYLTIVARGDHGGSMRHADNEKKMLYTRDEYLALIRTALAGRAAEIVYYGENDGLSTGVAGDLANATTYAQRILCNFGMDESFGLSVVSGQMASSDAIAGDVRAATNRILEAQLACAIKLINENKDRLDNLVEQLMSKNHLNASQIEKALLMEDSQAENISNEE